MDDRAFLDLLISCLPGLNPKDRITLSGKFEREEDLIRKSKSDMEIAVGHKLNYFWKIDDIRAKAERYVQTCDVRSIKWVSWSETSYPPLLREIYDPPVGLYYRGQLPDPEKSVLGIVGTRKPSSESSSFSYTLSRELGMMGIPVVSGLAIGIDAMSHRGNLEGGARTIAVLGAGPDDIYPSVNRPLARRILETGGVLFSEYPPGTGPRKWNFPARNRIISAFSRSLLVVEAPERSGSLITAGFALEQGRDLWVASSGVNFNDLPGPHFFDKKGTTKLAVDGAEIISRSQDIPEKWNMDVSHNVSRRDAQELNSGDCGKELAAAMAKFAGIDL
jgi:DNA processing protein